MRGRRRGAGRPVTVAIVLLVVLALFCGGGYYIATRFMTISNIVVTGSSAYASQQIKEAVILEEGVNMLSIRPDQIAREIEKALPYVGKASVKRRLPDTIVVNVSPAEPRVLLYCGEEYYLVSGEGKILRYYDRPENGFPTVFVKSNGVQAVGDKFEFSAEADGGLLFKILDSLEENGLFEDIGQMTYNDKYEIEMNYQSRITLRFGDYRSIEEKIKLAAVTLSRRAKTDRGVLDVSNTSRASFVPTRD